ncbi:MAG: mechanosensitive ion channel family protein [Cyanothece sp. SIO1E1]|nr:mechanosensitive ion channel family protein [Cyanothece sp. SIO1E1]
MDSLFILAEVGLVLFIFLLTNWLFGKLSRQLIKISWLKRSEPSIKTLRQNVRGLLIFICLMLCLLIVGINSWLIYRGENLSEYTLNLLREIPQGFWIDLVVGVGQCLCLLILVAILLRPTKHLLKKAGTWAKQYEQLTANDQSINTFFKSLNTTVSNGLWFLALTWCSQFLGMPAIISQYMYVLLKIYLIVAFGSLSLKVIAVVIDSLDALSIKYSSPSNLLRFYDRLRHLIPFLKRCLEFVIYVCMAMLIVKQIKLMPIAHLADNGPKVVHIIGIIFLSRVIVEVANLLLRETLLKPQNLAEDQIQSRMTIVPLLESILRYLIYFGGGVLILGVVGINPTPILAGAGIVGIAVGLGAQNLINDIVSGFFVLFENYYLVGDYIETKEGKGIVEAIELRSTRIRHPNGQLQIIRNGDIGSIINFSKQYIFAAVEVEVDYDANLDQVYEIIERIGERLKQDYPDVLEPTRIEGIEDFGDENLSILTLTKVKPGKHLRIKRILRKLVKDAFDQAGIEINPREQRFVLRNGSDAKKVLNRITQVQSS